jgi:hypothetical protein
MTIYVGYVLSDYATAIYMGKDYKQVKSKIDEVKKRTGRHVFIKAYDIKDNCAIELDCD